MLLGLAYHPSTSYQEVITLPLLYRDLGGIEYRKVKSDGMRMTGQKFQTLLGRAGPKKAPEWDPSASMPKQEGTGASSLSYPSSCPFCKLIPQECLLCCAFTVIKAKQNLILTFLLKPLKTLHFSFLKSYGHKNT